MPQHRWFGRAVFFAALSIAVSVAPARAAAGRRVAVLEIEGARTERLQQALSGLVKAKHEVLRATSYRDAARRMRATRLTPKDIKRVCGYLELDGVLEGTLVAEAGRYKLMLRLRSGKSGAIEWKKGMWLNAPRLSDRIARGLTVMLGEAIGELPSVAGTGRRTRAEEEDDSDFIDETAPVKATPRGKPARTSDRARDEADDDAEGDDDEDADAAPARTRKDGKGRSSKARKASKASKSDDDSDDEGAADDGGDDAADDDGDDADDDSDDDEGADDDGDDRRKRSASADDDDDDDRGDDDSDAEIRVDADDDTPRSPAGSAIVFHAGVSFSARRLGFTASGTDPPPGYKGGVVPGAYLAGEIYPMAIGGKGGLGARIGIGGVFDRVLKLESAVDNGLGDGGTVPLATTQQKYAVDVRYRHPLGALTAIASLGYSSFKFNIDKGAAPDGVVVDVPNVHYKSIDPGLGLRFQAAAKVALVGSAKLMLLRQTGEIQRGEQYGVADVLGVDGEAGLEIGVTDQIVVRAAGHYQRIGFTFKNQGDLTDRDDDGQADVGGAADVYFGGAITAGYAF